MSAQSEAIYEICRVSPRIFVLHPQFQRATFYAQQLRVLALVEGLFDHGHLLVGKRSCAVIGRGIAGLTTAAALTTLGASVLSIDKDSKMMESYERALHRELHPNIAAWPFQTLRSITNLPFLNWSCNTAAKVREQILCQWEQFAGAVSTVTDNVTALEDRGDIVQITCASGAVHEKNVVVVAAGFVAERPQGMSGITRYWTMYDFDEKADVLVSGSGDGGLIETATQFFGPKAVAAGRAIAYAIEGDQIKEDIAHVEHEARRIADDPADATAEDKAHERLSSFYRSLTLSPSIDKSIEGLARTQYPSVRLIHDKPSPYSPSANSINKVLLAYCKSRFAAALTIERGSVAVPPTQTSAVITCRSGTQQHPLHTSLIRHGADHAASAILSAAQRAVLDSNAARARPTLSAIVEDTFNQEMYLRGPVRRSVSSVHMPEDFIAEVEGLLRDLLSYLGLRTTEVLKFRPNRRRKGFEIKIRPLDTVQNHSRNMFPITIQNVKVSLMESRAMRFRSLGIS